MNALAQPAKIRVWGVARDAIIADLIGCAELKLQYAGWVVAIARSYPEAAHPIGSALNEIGAARYALDLAAALSRKTTPERGRNPAQLRRQVLAAA